MGENTKPWWAIDKAAWREKLALFYKIGSISKDRDHPLKPWSEEDIEEFIHSDPVHGPRVKLIRQAAKISAGGAAVGALTFTAVSWKYSRSPHGALLSLAAGAVIGWSLTQEGATVAFGLHKFDCVDENLKFLDWWKQKTEGS